MYVRTGEVVVDLRRVVLAHDRSRNLEQRVSERRWGDGTANDSDTGLPPPPPSCKVDGYACVAEAPTGWDGLFALFDGLAANAPQCSNSAPSLKANADLVPAPAATCGACTCTAQNATCSGVHVDGAKGNCQSCAQNSGTLQPGVCYNYSYGSLICVGFNAAAFYFGASTVSGGNCTPDVAKPTPMKSVAHVEAIRSPTRHVGHREPKRARDSRGPFVARVRHDGSITALRVGWNGQSDRVTLLGPAPHAGDDRSLTTVQTQPNGMLAQRLSYKRGEGGVRNPVSVSAAWLRDDGRRVELKPRAVGTFFTQHDLDVAFEALDAPHRLRARRASVPRGALDAPGLHELRPSSEICALDGWRHLVHDHESHGIRLHLCFRPKPHHQFPRMCGAIRVGPGAALGQSSKRRIRDGERIEDVLEDAAEAVDVVLGVRAAAGHSLGRHVAHRAAGRFFAQPARDSEVGEDWRKIVEQENVRRLHVEMHPARVVHARERDGERERQSSARARTSPFFFRICSRRAPNCAYSSAIHPCSGSTS